MTKHYASGDVNNQGMDPAALAAGFNMADVGDADTLRSLPSGVQGLYYLDKAQGVTADFVSQMNAIKGEANLFGVYLADEPDPSRVSAASLKAESDWIHANMPGVKTFIVADNQGSNTDPDFHNYYTQASTHIDLWGLDVYPFRTEMSGGDVTEVDRTVAAAKAQIGITTDQIVPVFQAFGGGNFPDGDGGKWSLPTPAQEKALFAEWQKFAPNPVFDYAYGWQKQEGDNPLSENAALINVFKEHNSGTSTTPPPTQGSTPPDSGTGSGTGTGTGSGTSSGHNPNPPTTGNTGGTTSGHNHHHHHSNGGVAHADRSSGGAGPSHTASSASHADTFTFSDLKTLDATRSGGIPHVEQATTDGAWGSAGHGTNPAGGANGSSAHAPASDVHHDAHLDHASLTHSDTPLLFQDHHLV